MGALSYTVCTGCCSLFPGLLGGQPGHALLVRSSHFDNFLSCRILQSCSPQHLLASGQACGCPLPHCTVAASHRDLDGFQGCVKGDRRFCCLQRSNRFVDPFRLGTGGAWVLSSQLEWCQEPFRDGGENFFFGLCTSLFGGRTSRRPQQKGSKLFRFLLLAQLLKSGQQQSLSAWGGIYETEDLSSLLSPGRKIYLLSV